MRNVAKKGGVLVGFHERGSSFVADMTECHVLPPAVSALLVPLRRLTESLSIRDRMPQVEVAVGDRDDPPRQPIALVFRVLIPPSEEDLATLRDFARRHRLDLWLQPKGPDSITLLLIGDGRAVAGNGTRLGYRLPEFGVTMPPPDRLHAGGLCASPRCWCRGRCGCSTRDGLHAGRRPVLRAGQPANWRVARERSRVEAPAAGALDAPNRASARGSSPTCSCGASAISRWRSCDRVLSRPRRGAEVANRRWPRSRSTAAARARQNAQANRAALAAEPGPDGVEFRVANLFEFSADDWASLGPVDKLLIDPPRDGALAVAKVLAESPSRPRRIVYVSCNPATLARDLSILVNEGGWRLSQAGVVNMFPHTAHVESIAVLDAGERPVRIGRRGRQKRPRKRPGSQPGRTESVAVTVSRCCRRCPRCQQPAGC